MVFFNINRLYIGPPWKFLLLFLWEPASTERCWLITSGEYGIFCADNRLLEDQAELSRRSQVTTRITRSSSSAAGSQHGQKLFCFMPHAWFRLFSFDVSDRVQLFHFFLRFKVVSFRFPSRCFVVCVLHAETECVFVFMFHSQPGLFHLMSGSHTCVLLKEASCARIGHSGLPQKRWEQDVCQIVPHVPLTTQSVKGLN